MINARGLQIIKQLGSISLCHKQVMELASTRTTPSRSKSLDFDCDDSRFLFKNRRFVSIDQGLSAVRGQSTASSSLYSGDSDYTDWGSFSEDDEIEVLSIRNDVSFINYTGVYSLAVSPLVVKFIISQRSC